MAEFILGVTITLIIMWQVVLTYGYSETNKRIDKLERKQ